MKNNITLLQNMVSAIETIESYAVSSYEMFLDAEKKPGCHYV